MLSRIKTLRIATGVSQKTLADFIGVSQQSINKYENHNIEPDIETLIRIADFFHVTVDFLIGHSEVTSFYNLPCEATKEEVLHLQHYRLLNQRQRQSIDAVIGNYLLLNSQKTS